MPPFLQNLLALPAKTKALLGISAIAILAIAFVMLKIATAPSYALIATGLDPAQTGKITAALDEQGIGYELRNNGTALAVTKSSTAQARIALAGAGVQTSGGGSQPGYELLDESKLGASQFQQPTGSIAAAAIVVTIPIIIMVLIFQRRIVAGLTAGAVKG